MSLTFSNSLLYLFTTIMSLISLNFSISLITLLLKKLVHFKNEISQSKAIAILGSGLVGSLAFTFTDSFWFNAVETEVYAMATLIMSVRLWPALCWE